MCRLGSKEGNDNKVGDRMNVMQRHMKLTTEKLAELKERKVFESVYIKCFICKEFIPAKEGHLLESFPTINGNMIQQVCELVCSDCLVQLPKSPLPFGSD